VTQPEDPTIEPEEIPPAAAASAPAQTVTGSVPAGPPLGAARPGLTWHFARPPVVELEYEMDCRGVRREQVIL